VVLEKGPDMKKKELALPPGNFAMYLVFSSDTWVSEEKTLESDFESLFKSESKLSSSFDDIEEET
jgi:hypothetical protein